MERTPNLIIVSGFMQQMPGGGFVPIMSLKSIEFCSIQLAPEFVQSVGYNSQGISWHLQTEAQC